MNCMDNMNADIFSSNMAKLLPSVATLLASTAVAAHAAAAAEPADCRRRR